MKPAPPVIRMPRMSSSPVHGLLQPLGCPSWIFRPGIAGFDACEYWCELLLIVPRGQDTLPTALSHGAALGWVLKQPSKGIGDALRILVITRQTIARLHVEGDPIGAIRYEKTHPAREVVERLVGRPGHVLFVQIVGLFRHERQPHIALATLF